MTHVRCPQCRLPAQIIDRFTLASTDGPVEHLKIMCPDRHWFTPPATDVEVLAQVPEAWAA